MFTTVLFIFLALFVVFAVLTQYYKTPADDSVPKRVWASLVAAAGVLGAIVMSWFNNGGATP